MRNKLIFISLFIVLIAIGVCRFNKTISTNQNNAPVNPYSEQLKQNMLQTLSSKSKTKEEFLEWVKESIANKEDLNIPKMSGSPLLILAVPNGYIEAAQLLLENGADINVRDEIGATALHRSCQCGHLPFVRLLIKQGANIEAKDNSGDTPLHFAMWADTNRKEIVNLLLNSGASVDPKSDTESTPLVRAISEGHLDIVEILIASSCCGKNFG